MDLKDFLIGKMLWEDTLIQYNNTNLTKNKIKEFLLNMDIVNILLATYNGDAYLKSQLKSIENQTYNNWYLIVFDDHSSDNTMKILEDFKNAHLDKVCIKRNEVPTGCAKNNFFSILKSKLIKPGYIMFCDQDDIWLPNKIEKSYKTILEIENNDTTTPALVYTDLLVVDENLNQISNSFFSYVKTYDYIPSLSKCLIQNNMAGCTSIINYKLYELVTKTDNINNILMHDWWILLLALCTGKVGLLNEPTIQYRQHHNNSIGAKKHGLILIIHKLIHNDTKISIFNAMYQAKNFLNTYKDEIDEKDYNLIKDFSDLTEKSKVKRIKFYLNNNCLKCGILRQIGQIIYG